MAPKKKRIKDHEGILASQELDSFQEDTLREVSNICASKVADSLQKMINLPIKMKMSSISVVQVKDLAEEIGDHKPVTGVWFTISGPIPGHLFLLSSKKASLLLVDTINSNKPGTTKTLNNFAKDTLKEIGNIVMGSFLATLSDMSRINMIESLPNLMIDKISAVLDIIPKYFYHRYDLLITVHTKFEIDEKDLELELIFLIKPEPFVMLYKELIKRLE